MLKIGFICAGSHAHSHHGPSLRDYRELHPDEIELTAVCDLDRRKGEDFAQAYGFLRVYVDYHLMIAEEKPDALIAITPVGSTFSIAGDLLTYRLPLLMEKPPGESARETRELLTVARRHGSPVMVSFNRRFNPALVEARKWLAENPVSSPPDLVIARMLRSARREKGFIVGTGIHLIDTTLSLVGIPVAVKSFRWATEKGGQSCGGTILTDEGNCALIAILPDAGAEAETYEVSGPEYSIRIDVGKTEMTASFRGATSGTWRPPEGAPAHVMCGAFGETEAFLQAVRTRTGYAPSLPDGLRSMLVAEALDRGGERQIGEQQVFV